MMSTCSSGLSETSIAQDGAQKNREEYRKSPRVKIEVVDPQGISKMEAQTFALKCEGLPSETIAKRRHRTLSTVHTQLESVYKKLGAHNATHALAIAISRGIVTVSLTCLLLTGFVDNYKLTRPRGHRQQISQRVTNGRSEGAQA